MGRPKSCLPFEGEPLIVRIARRLSQAVVLDAIVASPRMELPVLAHRILRDDCEGLGPLNGFATALANLNESCRVVYLSSCDVPFLKPAFVRFVLEQIGSHDIAIPRIDGAPQPLAAAYRVDGLREKVGRLLAAGSRRLLDLLPDADVRWITAEEIRTVDPELESLRNVNTPDEYEAALRDRVAT